MCAGLRVCNSDITYSVHGELVIERAIGAEDTAMAMGSIFAKTDVGNNKKAWESSAKGANGLDDGPLRIIGSGPEGVFGTLSHGHAKENDGAEAFIHERG